MGVGTGKVQKEEATLIFHKIVIIIIRSFVFWVLAHCRFAGGKIQDNPVGEVLMKTVSRR